MPTPPRYFAFPRRVIRCPEVVRDPVKKQTRGMWSLRRVGEATHLQGNSQAPRGSKGNGPPVRSVGPGPSGERRRFKHLNQLDLIVIGEVPSDVTIRVQNSPNRAI